MTSLSRFSQVRKRERFLPHLTLVMNRLVGVSVRDGGLRTTAIAVENLRHLPPVSSLCACIKVKDPREDVLFLVTLFLLRFSYYIYIYI